MRSPNPLFLSISDWFRRNFSDPGTVALFFTLLFSILFIEFFGHFFMPVLISIVLAYLLQSVVRLLTRHGCPHLLSVLLVFVIFLGLVVFSLIWLLPIALHQLQSVVTQFPKAFSQGDKWLSKTIAQYPALFADDRFQQSITFVQSQVSNVGQDVLKNLWLIIPNLITAVLYFILVPLLLFFFLKDSAPMTRWFSQFLPKDRGLIANVWKDVNRKIGCYVRGRAIEIIVVATVSSVSFAILGMNYAVLLGVLVGLSVIIPYIGAVIATIPVVVVGLMQWGITSHFLYLMITYCVIILLDANVLTPLLFADAMDLHPIVIILSVLVFGGMWGFWGVFFAIPLAMVADTILRNWPREEIRPL